MIIYHYKSANLFRPSRLVFDEVISESPGPSQGPEKQSQGEAMGEAGRQTPSEIARNTASAGAAIKSGYTQGTQTLITLVTTDPIFTGNYSKDPPPPIA